MIFSHDQSSRRLAGASVFAKTDGIHFISGGLRGRRRRISRGKNPWVLMMKPVFLLWTIALLVPGVPDLNAATLWLNPGAVSGFDGKTRETGFANTWAALEVMKSGDTLIIANGDWSRRERMTLESRDHLPPSGISHRDMTVIRAETDWGVTLPSVRDLGLGRKYVMIRGIVFSAGGALMKWEHARIVRCAFQGAEKRGGPAAFTMADGRYNLVEECLAWGGHRDAFLEHKSTGCIWRRCLAVCTRSALAGKNGPAAGFRAIAGDGSVWQNCISAGPGPDADPSGRGAAGFWVKSAAGAGEIVLSGCVALNGFFPAYYLAGPTGNERATLAHCAALGPFPSTAANPAGVITCAGAGVTVENVLAASRRPDGPPVAVRLSDQGSVGIFDSIASGLAGVGEKGVTAQRLWQDRAKGADEGGGLDALYENGLWYPVRLEENSPLAKGGGGDRPCGPVILFQVGLPGRAKDQPGWDRETPVPLWPFPNEEAFKRLLSEYMPEAGDDSRFLAGRTDLTHFIWEWLGKPAPPFNLRALQVGPKAILHWDRPPVTENLTGFAVYNVSAGSEIYWGKVTGDIFSAAVPGLTPGLDYGFGISARYADKGESALGYPVFFKIRSSGARKERPAP